MEAYSVGAVKTALDLYPPSFIEDAASLRHISVVELGLEDRLEELTGKGHKGRSAAVLSKGERGSSVGTIYLQFYRDPAQKKNMQLDDVASDLYYNLPMEVHKKVFELALAKEKNKSGTTSDCLTKYDIKKAEVVANLIMAPEQFFSKTMDPDKAKREWEPKVKEAIDTAYRLSGGSMDPLYWLNLSQD